jgi:aryl-alcohol dehydrogenase-like predicted oxidoreductase
VEEGLTTAVGVSNYSQYQMEEADDLLARYGIPLASNQVQYSLASRSPEENGLLKACKERGITLIAYSPLASGLLTDKTLTRTDKRALMVRPLLNLMHTIGTTHGDRSIAQVWLYVLSFPYTLVKYKYDYGNMKCRWSIMLDIEGRLMGSSCFSTYSYMVTTFGITSF